VSCHLPRPPVRFFGAFSDAHLFFLLLFLDSRSLRPHSFVHPNVEASLDQPHLSFFRSRSATAASGALSCAVVIFNRCIAPGSAF